MAETFSKDGKFLKSETPIVQTIKYDYETLLSNLAIAQAEVDRINTLISEAKKLGLDKEV